MTLSIRRASRLVPAVMLAAVALAGCAPSAAAPESSESAPAEPTTVDLALHFNSPQASWVGIYVAEELGYYEEAGIDLEIQYLGGSTLAVQAVGAGRADIGIAAPDALIAGVEQELPVVAVANHIQQDATGVIVNGEAASFEDLAGKTIATAQGTAESGLFQAALEQAGVTDDVSIDYVESAAKCTMMISGQADACTGFSYAQLIQAELADVDASFLPFSTVDEPLPGAVIFASESTMDGDADVIERFLEATFRGYRDADEDRELAVEVMVAAAETADPEQMSRATEQVLDLIRSDVTEEHGWGWTSADVWQNLLDELAAGGVTEGAIDPETLFTNDLLPEEAAQWR